MEPDNLILLPISLLTSSNVYCKCGISKIVLVIDMCEAGKEAIGLRWHLLYVYVFFPPLIITNPLGLLTLLFLPDR